MAKVYFNYFESDHTFAQPIINRLSASGHQIIMETISIDSNSDIDASIIYLSPESESNPGIQDALFASDQLKRLRGNADFKIFYLVRGELTIPVDVSQAHIIDIDNLGLNAVIELINNRLKRATSASNSNDKQTYNRKTQHFVVANELSIRKDPDVTAPLIGSLKYGEIVFVIEQVDIYSKINSPKSSDTGYAVQRYLKPVSEIQELLKKTIAPNLHSDGIFGPATAEAIRSFQSQNKLSTTGELNSETFQKLYEVVPSADSVTPESSQWLLKLNTATWDITDLSPGAEAWFHSHDLQSKKRKEYPLFQKMAPGDIVLGYATEPIEKVVCTFRVEQGLHNTNLGEGIRMVVDRVLNPQLPGTVVQQVLGPEVRLSINSPVRLHVITSEQLQVIMNTTAEGQKIVASYLASAKFFIRENVEPTLGVTEIAAEVAELIRNLRGNASDKGRMIGIFGNWGRGKTFLAGQVFKALENDPFVRVDFHAWKYQDTHASWAYLYEVFAQIYFKKNKKNWLANTWDDFKKRIRLNKQRNGTWPAYRFALTLCITVIAAVFAYNQYDKALSNWFWGWLGVSGIGISGVILSFIPLYKNFAIQAKAIDLFKKYYTKPSYKDLLGIQSEIQNELRSLLKCWIKEKNKEQILLFVDDIDRCSEDRMVQIIDALRVMLDDDEISKRVIVVAAIDERVLRRAIKWKYKELLDADRSLDAAENGDLGNWKNTTLQITSEYMDKLFIAGIKLGTLTRFERQAVFQGLSKGKVQSADTEKTITKPESEKTDAAEKPEEKQEPAVFDGLYKQFRGGDPSFQPKPASPAAPSGTVQPPPQPESFEFSHEEYEYMLQLVEKLIHATPRQIRIFYYRYLLARNLLTIGLRQNGTENAYPPDERNALLAQLLVHYTNLHSNEELQNDRRELQSAETNFSNMSVQKLIAGHPDSIITEILEALEMVIAY